MKGENFEACPEPKGAAKHKNTEENPHRGGVEKNESPALIYLPIIHLSPSSAKMAEEFLSRDDYDTLFVELPRQAQGLLKFIISERTVPPFSVMTAGEKAALLPLTAYSPEYVSVKTAARLKKQIVFIDDAEFALENLPADNGRQEPESGDEPHAERINKRSAALPGCAERDTPSDRARNLIESAVEHNAVRDAHSVKKLAEELGEMFALPLSNRERAMAAAVKGTPYSRAYVAAGAAHQKAFYEAMEKPPLPLPGGRAECYLVPYVNPVVKISNCGFYGELKYPANEEEFFLAGARLLRKAAKAADADYPYEKIPLSDVINALTHAIALSRFRGKKALSPDELKESALTVIAKGDRGAPFYSYLCDMTDGAEGGQVDEGCETPLSKDFRLQIKSLRINVAADSRITLDPMNPAHRKKSVFLRRADYLGIGLARLVSGADYVTGEGKNLKREVWKTGSYKRALTEITLLSHLGATVEEVCLKMLNGYAEGLSLSNCGGLAAAYALCRHMELDSAECRELLTASCGHVSELAEAAAAIRRLCYLDGVLSRLQGAEGEARELIRSFYYRALRLISPGETELAEEHAYAVSSLYSSAVSASFLEESLLISVLLDAGFVSPVLRGAADGITVRSEQAEKGAARLINYIDTDEKNTLGEYILGLSFTNPAFLLRKDFIEAVASKVEKLSLNEFLECAPNLRYGFSRLKNSEKRRIKSDILWLYGQEDDTLSADAEPLLCEEYLERQLALYRMKL